MTSEPISRRVHYTIVLLVRASLVGCGCKSGPSPVLSSEEESKLVNWAFEMAEIGYGQTRRQVCEMVKKFLDKDGRPNPFKDNRSGKDWWYAFVRRNPKLSL